MKMGIYKINYKYIYIFIYSFTHSFLYIYFLMYLFLYLFPYNRFWYLYTYSLFYLFPLTFFALVQYVVPTETLEGYLSSGLSGAAGLTTQRQITAHLTTLTFCRLLVNLQIHPTALRNLSDLFPMKSFP